MISGLVTGRPAKKPQKLVAGWINKWTMRPQVDEQELPDLETIEISRDSTRASAAPPTVTMRDEPLRHGVDRPPWIREGRLRGKSSI